MHGDATLPTLIYLPGLHGDWTLAAAFRTALANRVRFVEFTYPRSLNWSVEDYTEEISSTLLARGIHHGWLLAESWGSQIGWALIGRVAEAMDRPLSEPAGEFRPEGLILEGGFVRHPWKWGPGMLKWIGEHTPMKAYELELKFYARYAKFRHRRAPETLASMDEFVARRTDLDRQAMRKRLDLLGQFDPQAIARQTRLPVHYLAGLVDPLVPWVLVRWWLRRNCPGYRGGKTFWLADHNVLSTAPGRASEWVLKWMQGGAG